MHNMLKSAIVEGQTYMFVLRIDGSVVGSVKEWTENGFIIAVEQEAGFEDPETAEIEVLSTDYEVIYVDDMYGKRIVSSTWMVPEEY